jgi:hypothetical protein
VFNLLHLPWNFHTLKLDSFHGCPFR